MHQYGGLDNKKLYVYPYLPHLYEKHYRYLLSIMDEFEEDKVYESVICDISFFVSANRGESFKCEKLLELESKFWDNSIAQLPGGR